ncbi:hypothetical protein AAMO2058_000451000 [Amorphochlora amoebiformis]|mmetsp:Transcript_19060/g.30309  ORF Transcript_19060/g.30309 Transcript_19060/m.30309 type:complete len:175 (-) Transcript_19060:73-597(-)
MAKEFNYEKWLATLRENDQKALKGYLEGEVPDLEDLKLLTKEDMVGNIKPLTLNRIWKAINSLVGSPQKNVDTKALAALQQKVADTEHKNRVLIAQKESVLQQMSQLQRMYGEAMQQIEGLKNQLRKVSSSGEGKADVWIPSKLPPPNMISRGPGSQQPKSSRFYRPDRASEHV